MRLLPNSTRGFGKVNVCQEELVSDNVVAGLNARGAQVKLVASVVRGVDSRGEVAYQRTKPCAEAADQNKSCGYVSLKFPVSREDAPTPGVQPAGLPFIVAGLRKGRRRGSSNRASGSFNERREQADISVKRV